jgi:hypothetical protein
MTTRLKRIARHESLLVALGTLLWFLVLTPWGSFADPDAFYHAHIARLMLDRGALQAFPWLDLTTLGTHFADQHYLFHVVLGPAIAAFGEFWGTQLMAPILATFTALALWNVLRGLGVKHAWVWVALALLVPGFSFRLLLAKASPIAVGAFVVALGAMALKRPKTAFAAGALFALSHGGWIIAVAAAGLMLVADVVTRRVVDEAPWRATLKASPWKTFLALLVGILAGLLIHPNRTEIFRFLWVQVVQVGVLAGNGTVLMGREWLPADPGQLIAGLAPLLIPFLIGLLGLVGTKAQSTKLEARDEQGADPRAPACPERVSEGGFVLRADPLMRRLIMLLLPVGLTLSLTFKSERMIEYLVPALAIWVACLWQLVDEKALLSELKTAVSRSSARIRPFIIPLLIILAMLVVTHHAVYTWNALRTANAKPFNVYRTTISAISARANPGDRVFSSDWDEFPILFAADDRLRYISGLDPTFLHEADPVLEADVRSVTLGSDTTSTWDLVANRTGSRFVFITTKRHPNFEKILSSDPHYKEIAKDDTTAAYEVVR